VDQSIISRDAIKARGATAFDKGLGVDDHNMTPGAPAIRDWQFGWHTRRVERSRDRRSQDTQQLAEACPP
jgi:hypothetical protein